MSIRWTDYQRGVAEVVLRHRTEEGSGYDLNAVQQELPDVSKGIISKVSKALRENGWNMPDRDGKVPVKLGGDMATVIQPAKGAIIFTLGEHRISLNPQHLYDAYLYYEDIVLRHDLEVEFSLALKDSMKYAWERLNQSKAEREGISITLEEG